MRVWLQRVTGTRVRGGPVQVLRHSPSGDAGQIGRLVAEFADSCVLPAARAAGVRFTRPVFGPRSAVSAAAEMLFTRLADTADGEWPLADPAQSLWDELISSCLASRSPSIEPSWASGWRTVVGARRQSGQSQTGFSRTPNGWPSGWR